MKLFLLICILLLKVGNTNAQRPSLALVGGSCSIAKIAKDYKSLDSLLNKMEKLKYDIKITQFSQEKLTFPFANNSYLQPCE